MTNQRPHLLSADKACECLNVLRGMIRRQVKDVEKFEYQLEFIEWVLRSMSTNGMLEALSEQQREMWRLRELVAAGNRVYQRQQTLRNKLESDIAHGERRKQDLTGPYPKIPASRHAYAQARVPNASGIYFVWEQPTGGPCAYVGKAQSLCQRCYFTGPERSDGRIKRTDYLSWVELDEEMLGFAESYYYGVLCPLRNRTQPSRGVAHGNLYPLNRKD